MANSMCKYCGDAIKWAQEGGRWIPLDPETGVSHHSVCTAKGTGGAVKLRTMPKQKFGAQLAQDARYAGLEKRVTAIEKYLGTSDLTYKPFAGLEVPKAGETAKRPATGS